MKDPRYIVYLVYKDGFAFLNVIRWPSKEIWVRIIKVDKIKTIRKRITSGFVDKFANLFISADLIHWNRDMGRLDSALYKSANLKNIEHILEDLECTKISYLYYI